MLAIPQLQRARVCGLTLLLLCLMVVPALRADELRFGAEERLTGTLLQMADGKLTLRSDTLGEVRVPWASVTDVRTTQDVPVRLSDGRTLTGRLDGISEGVLRILVGGEVQAVAPTAVARIGAEPTPAAPPRNQWSGSVDLGLGALSGNSRRQDYRLGADVRWRRPVDRWHLNASVQHGQTRGLTDVARARAGLTYSRNLWGRHYYSTGGFVVHDDMKRQRLSGYYFLSRGYRLVETADHSSNLEVGGTYINDNYRFSQREDFTGLVRSVSKFRVLGNSSLSAVWMVWPSLGNPSHLRGEGTLSLNVPVGRKVGLSLGLTGDYDSEPPPDTSRHDLQTTLSLSYRL